MKVIYTGIFFELDADAKEVLFAKIRERLNSLQKAWWSGDGIKTFLHHLTICFRPGAQELNALTKFGWGKEVTVEFDQFASDFKAMALIAVPKPGVLDCVSNDHAHMTVCTKGVSPAHSNAMLENTEDTAFFPLAIKLRGKVGWYGSDGKVHFDNPVNYFAAGEKKEWFVATMAEGLGREA